MDIQQSSTLKLKPFLVACHLPFRAPRCESGPNCPLEGTPHPPHCNWRTVPSATALPSPPSTSLFPPPPFFAMLREGAVQAGVGGGQGGGEGQPSGTWGLTHIYGYSSPSRSRCVSTFMPESLQWSTLCLSRRHSVVHLNRSKKDKPRPFFCHVGEVFALHLSARLPFCMS